MQGRFAEEISKLKDFIEDHTKEPEDIPFLCQLESRLQCVYLKNKLDSVLNSDEIDKEDLIKLCESYLKERWHLVSRTQAVYFRTPQSTINRACVQLSKILANHTKLPAYEYLMPTVNSSHYDIMNVDKRIKLQDMVLGDKSEIIFVQHCLQKFEQSRQLYHTYNNQGAVLTDNEKLRVIHHSKPAKEYYDAYRLGDNEQLEIKRKALLDLLHDKKPRLKYDARGYQDNNLSDFVLNNLNSVFDLARYMQVNVEKSKQPQFLEEFFKKEHCADFIKLQGGDFVRFKKTLEKQLVNIKDELLLDKLDNESKDQLFQTLCLVVLVCCEKIREKGNDFYKPGSSLLNAISSYHSGSYSKQQKRDAITALVDYFSSSKASMIAVPTFLNQSDVIKPHIYALRSGNLEWFINQIEGFAVHFLEEIPKVISAGPGK